MFNWLVTILIVAIVGYMTYAESKYLFGKTTGCKAVQMKSIPGTIASAKSALEEAVAKVKQETQKIKMMLQQKAATNAPQAVYISTPTPIEHIQASASVVVGANANEDTIDENLPFSSYGDSVRIHEEINGIIKGVPPPSYADPRTINPSLAAAPVQFSDPAKFGTFGVTDQSTVAAFSNTTDAKVVSERTLEGFDVGPSVYNANGAVLVMDGKLVKSARDLPSYQLKGIAPHTSLPMRSLYEPPPTIEDIVEDGTFDGLQGYPIDEKVNPLTPPGMATPMSEWAHIMYNI